MNKNNISKENLQDILVVFLRYSDRSLTYDDLNKNKILSEISSSSIHRGVQNLQRRGIIDVSNSRGRPKGGERVKNFYLIKRKVVFKKIYKLLEDRTFEELLNSGYTNSIIKNYKFANVFDIVKGKMENSHYNRMSSRSLLKQPATIEEYRDKAKDVSNDLLKYFSSELFDFQISGVDIKEKIRPNSRDYAEIYGLLVDRFETSSPLNLGYRNEISSLLSDDKVEHIKIKIGYKLRPLSSKHIELLTEFDKLESVRLYRNVIYREIVESFKKLSRIPHLVPLCLYQFMTYDNYLSPFTSYPVQSPEIPLFSRPFQRIYDDLYLLGQSDMKFLACRAFVIYTDFAVFLSDFFRYSAPRDTKALRRELIEFIYLWNVSSTNFDLVWIYLKNVYKEQIGSGNYYLQSEGMRFKLTDLNNNEPLADEERFIKTFSPKPMLFERAYEARRSMDRPFTHLRPCLCFKDLFGESNTISIKQILLDLNPIHCPAKKFDENKLC